jgi:7-carboxy-7-deazaguanine synthase (Cx14CxxC type)
VSYAVKEIYYSLQGEGANVGRAAVFCRFAGCNLWSGREEDRAAAVCRFCDTDFFGTDGVGGGMFRSAEELARAVFDAWPSGAHSNRATHEANARPAPLVICTGGEPLLQLDDFLVAALHRHRFEIAIETNGTRQPPTGVDWICVSPKAGADVVLTHGDEVKVPYPQPGLDPQMFEDLEFRHYFVQPIDGPDRARNTALALEYCLGHPRWRLSLQIHKYLGIR